MSVQISVIDKRFYNDVTNGPGSSYTGNPTYFQPSFRGQVMQTMRFQCRLDISKTYNITTTNTIVKNATTDTLFLTNGTWADEGFQVGDVVRCPNGTGTNTFDLTIIAISTDGKTATYTVFAGTEGGDHTLTSGQVRWLANVSANDLTAVRVRFALNPNDQGFYTNSSMITGQSQVYFAENIGSESPRSTLSVPVLSLGLPKWWVDRRAGTSGETGSTIRFLSATDYVQSFEFSHVFVVGPWFLAGQLSGLQAGAPPSYFAGPNTLDYFAAFELFKSSADTALSTPYTLQIIEPGDIGWFGENFNGRPSTTTVNSFQILLPDLSPFSTAELPLYTQQVLADFQVRPNGGHIFQAGDRINVYFSYLPADQNEYRGGANRTPGLFRNFAYDWVEMVIGATEGDAMPSTGSAQNVDVFGISKAWLNGGAGVVQVRCTIKPIGGDIAKPTRLGSGSRAMIAVGSENTTQAFTGGGATASRLTTTIAQICFYEQLTNIGGFTMSDSGFYLQNQYLPTPEDADADLAISPIDLHDEDQIVHEAFIEIDATAGVVVAKIIAQLVATDGTNTIEFDRFEFDTRPATIVGDTPFFDISASRGYQITAEKQAFNLCQIKTLNRVGNIQRYVIRYATRVSYQSWLQNLTVPTAFFDPTKPQNNRNFQVSNYSNVSGYQIKIVYRAEFSSIGPAGPIDQTFALESDAVPVRPYGQSFPSGFSGTITTRDPDTLADLAGQIYADRDTLFETIWTVPTGTFFGDVSVWHRLEQENNPSFVSIADVYADPSPQPTGTGVLQSIELEQVTPTQLRSTCIIRASLLPSGAAFKLSARIEANGGNVDFRAVETWDIRNTDSASNFRII